MTSRAQVLGISNAIVDVLSHVDEEFLEKIAAPKQSMILIDQNRASEIYGMIGPATEMSGGSVANTIAAVASLGGSGAYIGKVTDDQLGRIFVHDMKSLGVDVRLAPAPDGAPTARCYVLITPDGERTMQTYLGACTELGLADINQTTVGSPNVMLLEGYIWDIPEGPDAAKKAMALVEDTDTVVALSLSDSFCVERHRDEFLDTLDRHVKIVFANEKEIVSLFGAENFDAAMEKCSSMDAMFVLTRSEKGSAVINGEETVHQDAYPVEKVIDATGAGDVYTAAFLHAWTTGKSLAECTDLGSRCGAKVIQQIGPRLSLDDL